jgi:hypothetical protein
MSLEREPRSNRLGGLLIRAAGAVVLMGATALT